MCNLYTHKMTAAEMRALMLHYQFHGLTWTEREERQRERNAPIEDVYPNKRAPVVVVENGEHVVREDMLWGFPKYKPGANWGTHFRTLKNGQWRPWLDREHRCIVPGVGLRRGRQDHTSRRDDVAVVQTCRWAAVLIRRDLAALDGRPRHEEDTERRRPHAVLHHDILITRMDRTGRFDFW